MFFLLGLTTTARAELELCNDTNAEQQVAIGYWGTDDWVSKGWWQIPPMQCPVVVAGPLTERDYYLRVETPGWDFRDDKLIFCVNNDDFTIVGDENCIRRRHRQAGFARIDTGTEQSAFRYRLSNNLTRSASHSVAHSGDKVMDLGALVFQGCRNDTRSHDAFCTFVGEEKRYLVYDNERNSDEIWEKIQTLDEGRRVHVRGNCTELFDTTEALTITELELLPLNEADRMLQRLQGAWQSALDTNDSFRIRGAERVSSYAGAETAEEYVSVQRHCGQADQAGQGLYLDSWDSNTGTWLCYRIAQVSAHELTLIYLPQGQKLRYLRVEETGSKGLSLGLYPG
ncbi:DUF1036 domain-containing protein [Phaeobacter sp. HF9A]|uniref:DUF1036 domain-containing protein n=1 Tax=Phaeobacter sp. HF9A TaxID=2721561 RepID=UPI001431CC32|nr:DUF1036 domain-containing protein [Phaeobacter sp. HF9A]NIZ15032.1 DUF1036 domain-containing protein [Phaeobacter sp. HF9A]